MKTTRPKSYQMGAAHERQVLVAYLRRRITLLRGHFELTKTLDWVLARTKRYNAKPGGLQGKRPAKSVSGKIKSAFGCKVSNL